MNKLILLISAAAIGLGACSTGVSPTAAVVSGPGFKVGKPYTIRGVTYVPRVDPDYDETGVASWYGPGFHGKLTASGGVYDQDALTAAHKTLPMPTRVRVTNLENDTSVILTVNDRGPFVGDRIIDVSRRAARVLGFLRQGTARVRVEALDSPAFAAAAGGGGNARASERGQFYVQAGSFANSRNAYRLQERLRSLGSFGVERAQTAAGPLHRVRAGPLPSRERARALISDLRAAGVAGARMIRD